MSVIDITTKETLIISGRHSNKDCYKTAALGTKNSLLVRFFDEQEIDRFVSLARVLTIVEADHLILSDYSP